MMEKTNVKNVTDDLNKYDYLANKDDYIKVTEWANGEGWDISINDEVFSITAGTLAAINYLTNVLTYDFKPDPK